MTRYGISSLALLLIASAGACVGETTPTEEPFEGVSPDDAAPIGGKADGADVRIEAGFPYSRVVLSGDAAKSLYGVMEDAGGFSSTRSGGLDYLYGYYTVCASNGSAAGCAIYSRDASTELEAYAATLHGPRFQSAASELFGAIARAQGTSPASVFEVETERFVCGKTSSDVWCGITPAGNDTVRMTLSLDNLGDLGADYVYEGWLITADGPVTSGRFDLSSASETVTFDIDRDLAEASTLFVLTIEPAVGDDPAPAPTHVVAGPIVNGMADLTAAHGAALGSDFSSAAGRYILETPTTSSIADDYGQGVWFVVPGEGAGLELPTLPEGWAYEGWVVGQDGPVSTGTFLSVDAPDSDEAGPAAGPDGAPPFPGQDFISPAMDVVGGAVVISVEPSPDNSPAPFFFKPLVDMTAEDVGPGVAQGMSNLAAEGLPTGSMAFDG